MKLENVSNAVLKLWMNMVLTGILGLMLLFLFTNQTTDAQNTQQNIDFFEVRKGQDYNSFRVDNNTGDSWILELTGTQYSWRKIIVR